MSAFWKDPTPALWADPPHKEEGEVAVAENVCARETKLGNGNKFQYCRTPLPSLVGRVGAQRRGGVLMPHSNINPKTRKRAQSLRREMTKAERIMWDILRDFRPAGAHFRREAPIGPYIADFCWLWAKIIVEVDGDSHEASAGRSHDDRRAAFLKNQGFTILRFENPDVIDAQDHVYLQLETALSPHLNPDTGRQQAENDRASPRKDDPS